MTYGGFHTMEELRAAPAEQVLAAQDGVIADAFRSGKGLPYAPVVNGHILTETVTNAIAAGHMAKLPTIIGSTRQDITVTEEESAAFGGRMHQSNVDYSLMCQHSQNTPAWVDYFQRQLPGDNAGAFHSSELWYTFGTLGRCWRPMTPGDKLLSERMMDHWCRFAKTGDPSLPEAAREPCTRERPFVMVFDAE